MVIQTIGSEARQNGETQKAEEERRNHWDQTRVLDGGGKNFALIRGHVDEIRLRDTQLHNIEVVPVRYHRG